VVGEVGLGGEVRSVGQVEKRVSEAEKLGFHRIVIPRGGLPGKRKREIEVVEVDLLAEAMEKIL